jgi:SAM-dependent methyltransferase
MQCPNTKQSLVYASDSVLKSTDGSRSYPVRDSVPNFSASPSWQTPNNETLQRLLDTARNQGYKTALSTVMEDAGYVTDTSRANYLSLLPLHGGAQVLEIGASLGQHTRLIAARSKHVEALEVIPEQALFAKLCCAQDGITNVCVSVGGDDCRLPYKDGVFDVVIMNYVLEWSAGRSRLPPKAAHKMIIHECSRVLKPTGVLFLSTKNRFNLRLLLGQVDEHVGFRFGNALPRFLMRLLSRAKAPLTSPGYLHSYAALSRIIASCGFRRVAAKLALPDARYPLAYSGFGEGEISALRSNQKLLSANRLTKFLLTRVPSKSIKWIAPSLVFIAEK